jgi:AcrR family transcriptional regulator
VLQKKGKVMARPVDPKIKEDLIEKCLEVFVEIGVKDFSLRKVANQLDTSARMLIYHFGSVENLFAEMIISYSHKEKCRFEAILNERQYYTLKEFIGFNWAAYLTPTRTKILTVFVEIYGQCLRDKTKYSHFFQKILFEWIEFIENLLDKNFNLSNASKTAWATLIIGTCRGLLMDYLASGETKRIQEAIALFQNLAEEYEGTDNLGDRHIEKL